MPPGGGRCSSGPGPSPSSQPASRGRPCQARGREGRNGIQPGYRAGLRVPGQALAQGGDRPAGREPGRGRARAGQAHRGGQGEARLLEGRVRQGLRPRPGEVPRAARSSPGRPPGEIPFRHGRLRRCSPRPGRKSPPAQPDPRAGKGAARGGAGAERAAGAPGRRAGRASDRHDLHSPGRRSGADLGKRALDPAVPAHDRHCARIGPRAP